MRGGACRCYQILYVGLERSVIQRWRGYLLDYAWTYVESGGAIAILVLMVKVGSSTWSAKSKGKP